MFLCKKKNAHKGAFSVFFTKEGFYAGVCSLTMASSASMVFFTPS